MAKKNGKTQVEILELKIKQLEEAKAAYKESAPSVDFNNVEKDCVMLNSLDDSSDKDQPQVVEVKKKVAKVNFQIPRKNKVDSKKSSKKPSFIKKQSKRKAMEIQKTDSEESMLSEEKAFQLAAENLAEDPDINNYHNI